MFTFYSDCNSLSGNVLLLVLLLFIIQAHDLHRQINVSNECISFAFLNCYCNGTGTSASLAFPFLLVSVLSRIKIVAAHEFVKRFVKSAARLNPIHTN